MEIYRTSELARCLELSRAARELLIVHVTERPLVLTGALNTLDLDACVRLGLAVGRAAYLGGSIVCMPGDLSLCRVSWGGSSWAPELVGAAAAWLTGRGISVTRDGNDVLADERKVISWARATTREGWCQSVVHFSVGPMDLGLVRAVCTKPMAKTPGSLGEYGITAEEILQALGIGAEVIGNGG